MKKPIASLSLDLDNKWAYLRTHGVASWNEYPSYLDLVVPRILRCASDWHLRMSCFVVGRDAEQAKNSEALESIVDAGHEIANHSLNHYPWMHTLPREQVEAEIVEAEAAIERVTGQKPIGFRGPGYSMSDDVLAVLADRDYLYDATTLPTYIGPLARWYFHRTATAEASAQADRRQLFGKFRDGLRTNRPYVNKIGADWLVEIPVTTFPLVKLPIHMTYLLYLWQVSPRLTRLYLRMALSACRLLGMGPSILLHPLDFLGAEDDHELRFFPGMQLPRAQKLELLNELMTQLTSRFTLVPMREHARAVAEAAGFKRHPRALPSFAPKKLVAVSE